MKRKKIVDIKISTAISILSVISLVSIILLWSIGYNKISFLKDNVENMYNFDILKMNEGTQISLYMSELENDINNQIIQYDSDLDSSIDYDIENLNKSINTYIDTITDDTEKKKADKLVDSIKEYTDSCYKIKDSLNENKEISIQEKSALIVNEKMTSNQLKELINNNDINVKEKYFRSEIAAGKSVRLFFIIGIISIVVLLSISTIVLYKTKDSLKNMIISITTISKGKFNINLDTKSKSEFGMINKALDKTVKSVSQIVSGLMNKTDNIVNESHSLDKIADNMLQASKEVYNATKIMQEGSEVQAQDLMNINKQFDEFSEMLTTMADAVEEIAKNNEYIHNYTNNGKKIMEYLASSSQKTVITFTEFSDKFKQFTKSISKIDNIMHLISDVTEQTQLLALNASIEAARAGANGKGFAVVADEVNKLSEESKNSADAITTLIKDISSMTEGIAEIIEQMGKEFENQQANTEDINMSFKNIIDNISKSASKIEMLNNSTSGIINERDKLVDRVTNASSIAEEISASAEEITTLAGSMDSYADKVVNTSNNLHEIVDETVVELNKFEV